MQRPRVQFTLRSLIAVVAIVAVLLQFPRSPIGFFVQCLAVILLLPAVVAPAGRRVEAAYWSLALHPMLFLIYLHLVWMAAWCLLGHRPLPSDYPNVTRATRLLLDLPYVSVRLSVFYVPVLAALGCALAAICFPRPTVYRPLRVVPLAWLATAVAMSLDPFQVLPWFWD